MHTLSRKLAVSHTSCLPELTYSRSFKEDYICTLRAHYFTSQHNHSPPDLIALHRCYPSIWQLDESMGTHLVNTFGVNPTLPDGTQAQPGAATAQECADQCTASDACIGSTWIYSDTTQAAYNDYDGMCLFYIANPSDPSSGYTLYVKVLPLDYLSGASTTGRAAVTSGAYVKYSAVTPDLGRTMSNTTAVGLKACKDACDMKGQCWGFYYNGYCALMKGYEAEGYRTFMHVVAAKVE